LKQPAEPNLFVVAQEPERGLFQNSFSFSQAVDWSVAVGFVTYGKTLRFASQQLGRKIFGTTLALPPALQLKDWALALSL
jgi:hypothetical protein